MIRMGLTALVYLGCLTSATLGFESRLPQTSMLELPEDEDRSAKILQGLHRYVDQLQFETLAQHQERWSQWDMETKREKLRALIGANMPVLSSELQWVDSSSQKSLWFEDEKVRVRDVKWRVLETPDGEVWAEGVWVEPKAPSDTLSLVIPHTAGTEKSLLTSHEALDGALPWRRGDRHYLLIKTVNRESEFSGSEVLNRKVPLSHREWIHRQSFGIGRTLTGYEVLSAQAALEAMKATAKVERVDAIGIGEGARVAMLLSALEPSVMACRLYGDFGPRDQSWKEPLDRNLQAYLRDFGDAAVASMIAPRTLLISNESLGNIPDPSRSSQQVAARPKSGNSSAISTPPPMPIASPGEWRVFEDEEVKNEIQKARTLTKVNPNWIHFVEVKTPSLLKQNADPDPNLKSRIKRWSQVSQKEVDRKERARNAYWHKQLSRKTAETIHQSLEGDREYLWKEVLGQLEKPDSKPAAKSKFLYETEHAKVYELWLEIAPDVVLWSWVGIPKSLVQALKKGEKPKLPVVVCQHGLEGLPEHTFTTDPSTRYARVYKSYALRLAEQGYITVAPHMPYRGEHEFRALTRKLNGIGGTIYSLAILQHQQLLEWLKSQSYVDPANIGFYGLSYGGKIAMRIPAILSDYKFSICSGDFNDWIMKISSDSFPASYIFTKEYEIWEWNLAERFNHAEMAYLIAPRGFMVEYGHSDGVSSSEWVGYEYGKIRRAFDRLKIPQQTALRYFDGTHEIEGTKTFEFMREQFAKDR